MTQKPPQHDDLLEKGTINLLPDQLRSAEEKAKKKLVREQYYQLREPKKIKRSKSLGWIPFFGGSHWSAGTNAEKTAPAVLGGVSSEPAMPPVPKTPSSPPAAPAQTPWTPVKPAGIQPIVAKPGAQKDKPKNSWLGIFFRNRKRVQMPTPIAAKALPELHSKISPQVSAPAPRHYSLLKDTETVSAPAPQPIQPVAVPTTSGSGKVNPPLPSAPARITPTGLVPKQRRGIHWPKWLDIFYVMSLLVPHHTSRIPKPAGPVRVGTANEPVTLHVSTSRRGVMPVPEVVQPTPPKPAAPAPQPVTPTVPAAKPATTPTEIRPVVIPTPTKKPVVKPHSPWWEPLLAWWRGLWVRKPKPNKPGMPAPAPRPRSIDIPVTPEQRNVAHVTPVAPVMPTTPVPARPAAPATPAPVVAPSGNGQKPVTQNGSHKMDKPGPSLGQRLRGALFHMPTASASSAERLGEVNLIPGALTVERSWKQLSGLLIVSVVITGAVLGAIYVGLIVFEKQLLSRTTAMDIEIAKYKDDIQVYKNAYEPRMTQLASRIALVNELLNKHIYWTNFFALLEKHTLPDVYYDGIAASTNGTLSLTAHGSSFATVTKQLAVLQSAAAKDLVTEAKITSANLITLERNGQRVDFTIELTLNPKLFYYGKTE